MKILPPFLNSPSPMPILDPSLQSSLISSTDSKLRSNLGFLLKFLKIASQNLNRNVELKKSHTQFRNDLLNNIHRINRRLHLTISLAKTAIIQNYFDLLDYHFSKKYQKQKPICDGEYITFPQRPHLYYYRAFGSTKFHDWYLTDNSLAILVCDFDKPLEFNSKDLNWTLCLLNLEIDVMIASGFTIAAVFQIPYRNSTIGKEVILKILKDHPIAEIHFNLTFTDNPNDKINYEVILDVLLQNFEQIKGYFYLYTPFFSEIESSRRILKDLRKKPFFKDIGIADSMSNVFKKLEFFQVQPFPFYNDGFSCDKIRINLSNVALYNSWDETIDFIPSSFSNIGFGFIEAKSFLNFDKGRVKIYFDNNTIKFCNFEDIHVITPDLYAINTLCLMEADAKSLAKVAEIKSRDPTFSRNRVNFASWRFRSLPPSERIDTLLACIIDSLHTTSFFGHLKSIELRPNQLFTIYEACNLLLRDDNPKKKKKLTEPNQKKENGCIYQVHTGEGKSLIILVIAAVLALSGKKVHIATSNIFLANRDYYNSLKFFKNFSIKTAVLLHKEELPTFEDEENSNDKKGEKTDETNYIEDEKDVHYNKAHFPDIYFGNELFENSSNMNIDVCGFGDSKNEAQVVYSTFINFEALYLRLMESQPSAINDYFNSSSLLIDEADSILIDELTNGTILSRPMHTNGKEILIYVYRSRMAEISAKEVLNAIKAKWPECSDIKKRDIKAMFKEIDLVNSHDFSKEEKKPYMIDEIDITKKLNFFEATIKHVGDIKKEMNRLWDSFVSAPLNAISTAVEKSFGHKKKTGKKQTPIQNDSNQTNSAQNDSNQINSAQNDSNQIRSAQNDSNQTNSVQNDSNQTNSAQNDSNQINTAQNDSNQTNAVENDSASKDMDPLKTKADKKDDEIKIVKYIVPFDNKHKGIREPNKEFNGFIQQFIAIKEMLNNEKDNKRMFIKDVSMSYLYVSHPTFTKLYGQVCGFTGTIGGKYERTIFSSQYKLRTMKIPRNKPNKRVDMPIVLCRNITERNQRITDEVIQFHRQGNPVLVIFQHFSEIKSVSKMLIKRGISNVNVFDGRDQEVKPDYIAGRRGAVSLGTNVCGRGTDIKEPQKPLHVIISYYTSNVRVMQQIFGRTGRKGQSGTAHIICHQEQYLSPKQIITNENMKKVLSEFNCKNVLQIEYIEHFKCSRPWIFQPITTSQNLSPTQIGQLRGAKINVNRIDAFNYKFPLCLSIKTFLRIQAQKIFSLFNCPNSKYTWMLFQRYIREMIFESWSLFVERTERRFMCLKHCTIKQKNDYMNRKSKTLLKQIGRYLPDKSHLSIVETFMWIHQTVVNEWQDEVLKMYKSLDYLQIKQTSKKRFISFNLGFRPYCLKDCSGARINDVDDDERNLAFIFDPELSYVRKNSEEKIVPASITEAIDKIFNKICNKISDFLGAFLGIRFFLRRTLAGCEFGLCFDFVFHHDDQSLQGCNCLIDLDPLLVFTISVRSTTPFLAGILIFGLVYLSSISSSITSYIAAFPQTVCVDLVKKTIKAILKQLLIACLSKYMEAFCDKIIDFLDEKLKKRIEEVNEFDSRYGDFLSILSQIITTKEFNKAGEKINNAINSKVKVKISSKFAQSIISEGLPTAHLLKIGLLLLLNFAAFMIAFQNNKKELPEPKEEKNAAQFNQRYSDEKVIDELVNANKDAYPYEDEIEPEHYDINNLERDPIQINQEKDQVNSENDHINSTNIDNSNMYLDCYHLETDHPDIIHRNECETDQNNPQ